MAISIWQLLISLWLLFILAHSSVVKYDYPLVSTGKHLQDLDLHDNVRSKLECGRLCVANRKDDGARRMCEAFVYNTTDATCQLYSAKVNGTAASNIPVYRFTITDDDPDDGFEYLEAGGETFIYHVSSGTKTYETSRAYCLSLNAYMLHMDTVAEFDAILQLLEMKGITGNAKLFIGANDIENEGVWVCDRHNIPLDFSTWVFKAGNPNDYGVNGEDCATYQLREFRLNDVPCDLRFKTICERTP